MLSNLDDILAWYLVRTHAGKEETAADNLASQRIEVFAPFEKQTRPNGLKRKSVPRPVYPRYIFTRFILNEKFQAVSNTRGVSQIVRFGDGFAIVDDAVVESIQAHTIGRYVRTEDRNIDPQFGLALDEVVSIISGAWTGHVGKFKGPAKDGVNMRVLIEGALFGKDVEVPIPLIATGYGL